MSSSRRAALGVLFITLLGVGVVRPAGDAQGVSCWLPPVTAPITDPFREPDCPWCPGNRGVEFGTAVGDRVRAVAAGRVAFAGSVAGVVFVVVRLADGRRVTYGNLLGETFEVGDVVVRRQLLGRTAGRFHFGLREGDRYVDPGPFLGRHRFRPRLIPVDGSRPLPAPPPRLVCRGR